LRAAKNQDDAFLSESLFKISVSRLFGLLDLSRNLTLASARRIFHNAASAKTLPREKFARESVEVSFQDRSIAFHSFNRQIFLRLFL
jgi:hypothetical protein